MRFLSTPPNQAEVQRGVLQKVEAGEKAGGPHGFLQKTEPSLSGRVSETQSWSVGVSVYSGDWTEGGGRL